MDTTNTNNESRIARTLPDNSLRVPEEMQTKISHILLDISTGAISLCTEAQATCNDPEACQAMDEILKGISTATHYLEELVGRPGYLDCGVFAMALRMLFD